MQFLTELLHTDTAAGSVLVLGLVAALGLALGSVRIFGVRLGIAGVLFAGLLLGHFRLGIERHVMEFTRDLGLILFVYGVGLQVGPGFFSSLRREGLALNLMAASIVGLGVIVTLLIVVAAGIETPVAMGMFSGATTNTPSLAAAQAALQDTPGYTEEIAKMPGLGYAVSYPFGILGIILTMLMVRVVFRIDIRHEEDLLQRSQIRESRPIERMNIKVENPNLEGIRMGDIPMFSEAGVVFSRILHGDRMSVVQPDTRVVLGDIVLAVGQKEKLRAVQLFFGSESLVDLHTMPGPITTRRLLVTRKDVLGETLDSLAFDARYAVQITRIRRTGVELPPGPDVRLQFGDSLMAVGEEKNIGEVARIVGDSAQRLNQPEVLPVFIGIVLGALLGSWPIHLPGAPAPIKLGMAGGPLLVAILLSRIGRIGSLVWFLPASANFMLRELGIVLFLACVGLKSGDSFLQLLVNGQGLYWMALSALITLVPLVTVALVARASLKMNFMRLCGVLAGSMTDPPALAFAGSITSSEAPTVAYATVYPLTMILRILAAQLMVLLLPH